jgi:hypothetical protein
MNNEGLADLFHSVFYRIEGLPTTATGDFLVHFVGEDLFLLSAIGTFYLDLADGFVGFETGAMLIGHVILLVYRLDADSMPAASAALFFLLVRK